MPNSRNAMHSERVIGFDFGLKRIGVATGNMRTGSGQALCTLSAGDGVPHWPAVDKLIAQWLPATLLVGLPLHMNGGENATSMRARDFGAKLAKRFDLDVVYVDERLSTHAADVLLCDAVAAGKSIAAKRRKHRDSLAAELIVRSYLNAHN